MNVFNLKKQIKLSAFGHDILYEILKNDYVNVNDKISKLIKSGVLIKLKKGLYCFSIEYRETPLDFVSISSIIYSPSYVSFEYALSYHSMIPERVQEISCATSKNTKNYDTPIGRFSYKKIPLKAYPIGVNWLYDEIEGGRFIASPEKALCDKIKFDRGIGCLGQKAMINYLINDLRLQIDFNLDIELIKKIADAYKSKNLNTLAIILTKGKI